MRLFADYAESDAEIGGVASGAGADSALLAKERASVQSALAGLGDAIGAAESSYASLVRQRGVFAAIRGKLGELAEKLPAVNGVIERIRRHEQRDTLVLAVVIALCMFISFVYIMNK